MGLALLLQTDSAADLIEQVLLALHLICLQLDRLFLGLELLDVAENAVIELLARCRLELLIGSVLVHIHNLLLNLALLLCWDVLLLFDELVFGNIDQVGNVSCWLCVLHCLASAETEALLLLADLDC